MKNPDNTAEEKEAQRPALQIDWEFYARFLEETDATEDQKRELIETLWSIVCSFVNLGFGVEPVQQAIESRKLDQLIADRRRIAPAAKPSPSTKAAKEIAKKGYVQ